MLRYGPNRMGGFENLMDKSVNKYLEVSCLKKSIRLARL